MRLRFLLIVLACGLLPGCSILGEVNQTLDYVNETTEYINDAATFAEQIPALAEQAVNDLQARTDLLNELEEMKNAIMEYNRIEVPAIAQDIHQQLESYNETLLNEINGYMEKIKNDVLDLDTLKETEIFRTIEEITKTLDVIQQLG